MNSRQEWLAALDSYQKALGSGSLERLHCHLSGIEYSDKGEQNHLTLEESDFNLEALFQALKDVGAKGRILCESPTLEEDAIFNYYLKRLLKYNNLPADAFRFDRTKDNRNRVQFSGSSNSYSGLIIISKAKD